MAIFFSFEAFDGIRGFDILDNKISYEASPVCGAMVTLSIDNFEKQIRIQFPSEFLLN